MSANRRRVCRAGGVAETDISLVRIRYRLAIPWPRQDLRDPPGLGRTGRPAARSCAAPASMNALRRASSTGDIVSRSRRRRSASSSSRSTRRVRPLFVMAVAPPAPRCGARTPRPRERRRRVSIFGSACVPYRHRSRRGARYDRFGPFPRRCRQRCQAGGLAHCAIVWTCLSSSVLHRTYLSGARRLCRECVRRVACCLDCWAAGPNAPPRARSFHVARKDVQISSKLSRASPNGLPKVAGARLVASVSVSFMTDSCASPGKRHQP